MLIYACIMVVVFGVYLVIDTQMIIGEKKYEINDEDYVLGALILYLDIIMLFIYILRIIGNKDRN